MLLPETLFHDSIELLTKLLASAESSSDQFFGLDASDRNSAGDISRASAQLIEICSWLGLLPILEHRLVGLTEFLQPQATTDPSQMYSHPSRLKALLLVGKFDHLSMENSIQFLLKNYDGYLDRSASTRLAYTDFIGIIVHYAKTGRLPGGFPSVTNIIARAAQANKDLLRNHWELITNQQERDKLEPRDLSYAMWLLFLGGYYKGSRSHTFQQHLDYLEDRTESITNDVALQKYRRGEFSRLIYPHIFLCFIARKLNREIHTHSNFLNWLSVCAKHLLDDLNGYHAGLLIKQLLAIDKNEFLSRYLNSGFSALIEKQSERQKASASELSLLSVALRQSTTVDLKDVRRLTGGWSRARVYRVTARILLPLSSQDVTRPSPSYVVKIGPPAVLRKAAMIYDTLPHEARKLFAGNSCSMDTGTIGMSGDGYSVIEWLDGFEEYASLVQGFLPDDPTQSARTQKLLKATKASLSLIKELHSIPAMAIRHTEEPPVFEVRIGSLFQRFDVLSRKASFLAVAIKRGVSCESGGSPLRVTTGRQTIVQLLNRYYRIPLTTAPAVHESRDVVVHGDCHGNNIMISQDFASNRFIDIGDVHVDDYLLDYAQLAAHVCFSMNLERYSDEELSWFTEPFGAHSHLSSLDGFYPERWSALGAIWKTITDELRSEIEDRESIGGLRRFAFYLADRLIFVASKSPSPVKALVLYLQGMLILESLADALVRDPRADELQEVIIPPGKNVRILV